MKNSVNSIRTYNVVICEGGSLTTQEHSLDRLLNVEKEDYEYIYAINDIIDQVLDLKDGEAMYFQPNRDNKLAKGIIQRFK